jgi:hypothetical protein
LEKKFDKEILPQIRTIAELYVRGITLTNEFANVVVAIGDIKDGDYLAALNLIPAAVTAAKALGALKLASKITAKLGSKVCEFSPAVGSILSKFFADVGCFRSDTHIMTADGLRPIQSIQPQERVWAYDVTEQVWTLQRVLESHVRAFLGMMVTFGAGDDVLACTPGHPVWVTTGVGLESRPPAGELPEEEHIARADGRWVAAGDLVAGDQILLQSGETAVVKWVERGEYDGFVYNLTIEHSHTFAVGHCGILVHNVDEQACQKALKALENAAEEGGGNIDETAAKRAIQEAQAEGRTTSAASEIEQQGKNTTKAADAAIEAQAGKLARPEAEIRSVLRNKSAFKEFARRVNTSEGPVDLTAREIDIHGTKLILHDVSLYSAQKVSEKLNLGRQRLKNELFKPLAQELKSLGFDAVEYDYLDTEGAYLKNAEKAGSQSDFRTIKRTISLGDF